MTTWEAVHDLLAKLVAWPEGDETYHVPRHVADRAIAAMRKMEIDGYPPPKLWPFEGTDLILTWRSGQWSIYQHFCPDAADDHTSVHYSPSPRNPTP